MYLSIKNRYVGKWVIAAIVLFSLNAVGYSQVELKGPAEGSTNKPNIVNLVKAEGNDLKALVLKDGVPLDKGSNWTTNQDWDGQKSIWLYPEQNGIYTVIVTVNKDNKTYQAVHVLTIGKPVPVPGPVPVSKFQATYDKINDPQKAQKLQQLISIWEEGLKDLNSYKTYNDLLTVLKNTAAKFLGQDDLGPLRDDIGLVVLKQLGTDLTKFNADLAKSTLTDVIANLKSLK